MPTQNNLTPRYINMADAGIISGIITGACAISLYLVKQLTESVCKRKMRFSCQRGGEELGPEHNPLDTLMELYEETIDTEGHVKYDSKEFKFSKRKESEDIWDIKVDQKNSYAHLYKVISEKPETGYHYLRLNLSNVTRYRVHLFVKRFQGPPECWDFIDGNDSIEDKRAVNGINCIYIKSLIGKGNVTKEQIGLTIKTGDSDQPSTCIVNEAYYGNRKLGVMSCCGGNRLYYGCQTVEGVSGDSTN